MDAIRAIVKTMPEAIVGTGTVTQSAAVGGGDGSRRAVYAISRD